MTIRRRCVLPCSGWPDAGGELELLIETGADLVGWPTCGAVAQAKDRRPSWVRDLPVGGRPVMLCWWKRVWSCPHPSCEVRTWTEQHEAIGPRASLTERARQWAFEEVGKHDAAVAHVAAELGVAWSTVMGQVVDRSTPVIDDSARLAPAERPVTAVGVDETGHLHATATHATTFATAIADLSPGRPARLLDVVVGRSGSALAEWLDEQEPGWRAAVTTASLDPFRGNATTLAWTVAQQLMDLYRVDDPVQARARTEQLIADLLECPIPELARLGRTLHAWRTELCAHFDHRDVSNGPTENLNLKIKNTKRIARGYRNFDHYRLRLLLNHGRTRQDRPPTRIRTRAPRFAA